MNETIYILLPVHNRREVTRRFINCLKLQSYRNYHLVLIDDGSSDGTADMVRENVPSLSVITGNGNWWWAGALQQGYRWLRERNVPDTDIVLIINDDTEFDADFLRTGVDVLREQPITFLLAECYERNSGAQIDAGIHVDWKRFRFEQPAENKPLNCLSTRGLFFRIRDFFRTGGFHPILLPHYLSDYEFTLRAQRRGIKLMTTSLLRVRLDASTTGHHDILTGSVLGAARLIFSQKSAINPVPLCVFIALACPWRYKLSAWTWVLRRSVARAWEIAAGKRRQ
jgi:GT2 family glycosyltransferase